MVVFWYERWESNQNYWAHTARPTVRWPMEQAADDAQLVLAQLGFTVAEARAFRNLRVAEAAKGFDLGEFMASA